MRKEVPEIGWGDYEVIPVRQPGDPDRCAIVWRNNAVLFVHNLDGEPCEVTLWPPGTHRTPAACW